MVFKGRRDGSHAAISAVCGGDGNGCVSKSLDENKSAPDRIEENAMQELAWERATIEDHVENGLFRKDYAVSLVTDADGAEL